MDKSESMCGVLGFEEWDRTWVWLICDGNEEYELRGECLETNQVSYGYDWVHAMLFGSVETIQYK